MTLNTITALEQALTHYGDAVYRLALLLASNRQQAADMLITALRRLAASDHSAFDEHVLIAALLDALPPERSRRVPRSPEWTKPTALHTADAPLLIAIARLPRRQRLVLGLAFLRPDDPVGAAMQLGVSPVEAGQVLHQALRSLAPTAPIDSENLEPAAVLEACQPTRVAIVQGDPQLGADTALRGHLALCADCRAVAHAWQSLSATVEQALRAALREARLPESVTEQAFAVRSAPASERVRRVFASSRFRKALVPLAVIGLILALVAPRSAPTSAPGGATAGSSSDPQALARRALNTLYAPQQGEGIWRGQWQFYYRLASGAYVPLVGSIWHNAESGERRAQLVHKDGGGPFEFILTNGRSDVWYATTENYGETLYPLIFRRSERNVRMTLDRDGQERLFTARMNDGAWGLASAYLQQAQASELRSWGSQRNADGTVIEVISYEGTSPLGPPPDAPNIANVKTTILLSIDATDGSLREVREIVGQPGSEQVGRTTWRFLGQESLTQQQINADGVFNVGRAWNGTGNFIARRDLVVPELPFINPNWIRSLADPLADNVPVWLPGQALSDTRAVLFTDPVSSSWPTSTIVYFRPGQHLMIDTAAYNNPPAAPDNALGEQLTLNDHTFILTPGFAQTYNASFSRPAEWSDGVMVTTINARGYTRAELIDILQSLRPIDVETYRAQAMQFISPAPIDPAVFDALLGALAPPIQLQPNSVYRFVERFYTRQNPTPDSLTDPYHAPAYSGQPEEVIYERWQRTDDTGEVIETATFIRGADGTTYDQSYRGPTENWYYRARDQQVFQFTASDSNFLGTSHAQRTALEFLNCQNVEVASSPQSARLTTTINDWLSSDMCIHGDYIWAYESQGDDPYSDNGPYLRDILLSSIVTDLYLDQQGLPSRIEVQATTRAENVVLESWERVGAEQVPADQVPADVFNPALPPQAVVIDRSQPQTATNAIEMITIPLTDALQRAQSPLFVLPADDGTRLETITSSINDSIGWGNPFITAVEDGRALLFTYFIRQSPLQIYQGPADRFGDHLRSSARWQQSVPIQLSIDGRMVEGWEVQDLGVGSWILVELDGTLLAIEADTAPKREAISRLERAD